MPAFPAGQPVRADRGPLVSRRITLTVVTTERFHGWDLWGVTGHRSPGGVVPTGGPNCRVKRYHWVV